MTGRPCLWDLYPKAIWELRARKFKQLREAWGLTGTGLASDAKWNAIFSTSPQGIKTRDGISRLENLGRPLTDECLPKVAEYYGIKRELMADSCSLDFFIEQIDHHRNNMDVDLYEASLLKDLRTDIVAWEKADFRYKFVTELSTKYYDCFFNHIKTCTDDMSNKIKAFMLIATLYNKGKWPDWILPNKANHFAWKALAKTFDIDHLRVRLRVLYALQYLLDKDNIEYFIGELNELYRNTFKNIYNNYIFKFTVNNYIELCASDFNISNANKAHEVMAEINNFRLKKELP